MALPNWLQTLFQVAPIALAFIPGVPHAIIPYVQAGIASAETIPGATGPQKLAASIQIAQAGFAAAQAAGAHVDAQVAVDALPAAVNGVVAIVNAVHK